VRRTTSTSDDAAGSIRRVVVVVDARVNHQPRDEIDALYQPGRGVPLTSGGRRPEALTRGAVMTYLIVGLDRKTFTQWHENVSADEIATATRIAQARAKAQGIDLVVAAVIGSNSAVMSDPAEVRPLQRSAA
jgi:hypothetical protein